MIEAPHYSATGAKKKSVSLPAALFDGTVNEHALHRAVVTFLANQRQGSQRPERARDAVRRCHRVRDPVVRCGRGGASGIGGGGGEGGGHGGGPAGRRDGGLRCLSCITPSWRPWSPRNRRRPMGRARSTRFECTRKRPNRRSGRRSSRSSRSV